MNKMPFFRAVFLASLLVFCFSFFTGMEMLYAQDEGAKTQNLTQEDLQQLRELYGSAQGSDDTIANPASGDTNYSQETAVPFEGGGDLISTLYGSENNPDIFLMILASVLGKYWWIAVVFYFLSLLFLVFILYTSAFKGFKRFSREQAMAFGWNTTKKHIWFFVLIFLTQIIIYSILFILFFAFFDLSPSSLLPILKQTIPYSGYYASALFAVLVFFFILFILGTTKISLIFADRGCARVRDLFNAIVIMPKLILSALLYGLIIFGPYVLLGAAAYFLKSALNPLQLGIGTAVIGSLLAIPVSYWIVKFYLYYIVVIDKGVWPIQAFKLASQYSKGAKTDIALFLSLLTAVNLVGFNVPFFLGLFATLPLTSLALAHAYRKLEKG